MSAFTSANIDKILALKPDLGKRYRKRRYRLHNGDPRSYSAKANIAQRRPNRVR